MYAIEKKAKHSDYYSFIGLFQAQLLAADISITHHVIVAVALR